MKKPVLNSMTAALPESVEAGKSFTIQLAPKGEYPQFVDDGNGGQKEVVQILDDKSIQTLVDNFKDKVLVDADHSSETSTDTKAMAWVTRLFVDPEKGLMADIEPTTVGADVINGKVYRFVSGAWTLDDDGRPQELVSIGLTNKPNLPVAPMINAQVAKKEEAGIVSNAGDDVTLDRPDADAATAEVEETQTDTAPVDEPPPVTEVNDTEVADPEKEILNMDIRAKLGLPAEATDQEVETALDALLSRCEGMEQVVNALGYDPTTATNEEVLEGLNAVLNQCGKLQNAQEEAQQAQLNAEADQLVAENEDILEPEQAEAIRTAYPDDPEGTKEAVANMRKAANKAVMNARAKAEKATKPVAINWRAAKKPVALNMESMLAECGGDPAKENAMLAKMSRG